MNENANEIMFDGAEELLCESDTLFDVHFDDEYELEQEIRQLTEMVKTLIHMRKTERISPRDSLRKIQSVIDRQELNDIECSAIETTVNIIIDKLDYCTDCEFDICG